MKAYLLLIITLLILQSYQINEKGINGECLETFQFKQRYIPDPMSVQGSASLNKAAECVSISLTIETTHLDAAEATRENANIFDKVKTSIMADHQVSQDELSTSGLSIQAQYISNYNSITRNYDQKFNGYQVINQLQVKTKQIEQAGKIIDTAIQKGVTRVGGITYELQPATQKAEKDKLINSAVEDARKKALIILNAIDYEITGIKSININSDSNVQNNRYQNSYIDGGDDSGDQVSTFLYNQGVTLSISVNVGFIIKQKPVTDGQ